MSNESVVSLIGFVCGLALAAYAVYQALLALEPPIIHADGLIERQADNPWQFEACYAILGFTLSYFACIAQFTEWPVFVSATLSFMAGTVTLAICLFVLYRLRTIPSH